MKIYLICPVRLADEETQQELAEYVETLENQGHQVYYPRRDTDESLDDLRINLANRSGVRWADEVHIYYMSESQGIHFDMGMAFMADKPLYIVKTVSTTDSYAKSYPKMLVQWQEEYSTIAV